MDITKFNEKFNRVEGNIYTVEEVVTPVNGVYENELIHDNVDKDSINIYTGSKLTGNKINTYTISTPSLTPWKTVITIYSTQSPLYITYETTGDQVEAEDINNLQDSVNDTQKALNNEITRATNRENTIESNLNKEIDRAKAKENEIVNNLNAEVTRAKNAEKVLTDNLNSEITRAKTKESQIDTELANRYTKDKVFTKEEVLAKIESLINNAPDVLDTFKEIADALGNDPNFATTMTTMLSQKVDKVTGKGLSANDFTDTYKNNLIDCNNKKHEHSNKSIIDKITQVLLDNWNAAFTHISDTVKHITSAERTLWNTVSNKLDKGGNAVSATKLQTARKISLADNIIGNANFDGSGDITINARLTRQNLTGATIDLNTLNHSDGTCSRRYIENTTGGCANISNAPVKEPFILDVELIRYSSSTDYISKQTFTSATTKRVYERYCTNGTWTSWGQVYTTTNKPTKADVGLGNVDNTSDLNKPISTATQTALNGKANSSHTHTKSQITDMPTKLSQFTNDAGFVKQADIDTSQNHTHSNKAVLDKITQSSLDSWNSKAAGNHTHNYAGSSSPGGDANNALKLGGFPLATTNANKGINWSSIPQIGADGVTEIGRYLDFHYSNNGSTDYDVRLEASTDTLKCTKPITANLKGNADSATKATQDSDGKQINTTYVKKGMTWNQLEGV